MILWICTVHKSKSPRCNTHGIFPLLLLLFHDCPYRSQVPHIHILRKVNSEADTSQLCSFQLGWSIHKTYRIHCIFDQTHGPIHMLHTSGHICHKDTLKSEALSSFLLWYPFLTYLCMSDIIGVAGNDPHKCRCVENK